MSLNTINFFFIPSDDPLFPAIRQQVIRNLVRVGKPLTLNELKQLNRAGFALTGPGGAIVVVTFPGGAMFEMWHKFKYQLSRVS